MTQHSAGPDKSAIAAAHKHLGFLLCCHRIDYFVYVVGPQLRSVLSRQTC